MTARRTHSWQSIHALICQNIDDQTWAPGDLIPGEVALAKQFGCARTTVNRALRELAATGLIDRKRKAGTRIAKLRIRKATAEIPVIKSQVELSGKHYTFDVLTKRDVKLSARISAKMKLAVGHSALHIKTVHYANERPFVYEDRWINHAAVPEVMQIDFNAISVNEWLVRQVPFSAGHLSISAQASTKPIAKALQIAAGEAVLHSERQTWLAGEAITLADMYYQPNFYMQFDF